MSRSRAPAIALCLAPSPAAPAVAQEQPRSEASAASVLFTHTAKRGTLEPAKGKGRFTLTLRGVAPQVVWFNDRPARKTGHLPMRGFVRRWARFGFVADPPNAALTLLDAANHLDTVVVELGRPRYQAKRDTIRYAVRVLDDESGLPSRLDKRVPRRFGAASLFIDDVPHACVYFMHGMCSGANLNGVDLTGEFLNSGDFSNASFSGATLNRAHMSGARFMLSWLNDAGLEGVTAHSTNFSSAVLWNASLVGADLTEAMFLLADLTDADLRGAVLARANLRGAFLTRTDLRGADLAGADLTGAEFDGTICPDGRTVTSPQTC